MAVNKRILLPALLICLLFLFSACRVRISSSAPDQSADTPASKAGDGFSRGEHSIDGTGDSAENEESAAEADFPGTAGDLTKENPEASRKEYDENAQAEIVPGTEHLLHQEGEGPGASRPGESAGSKVNRLNDEAEETALLTVPAAEAEQKGVSEDGEEADSAMTYFSVLLQDRMGSLFECQRSNIYWETVQDHVTIHKSSPEHDLILKAGSYDVSSRLLPENLRVDDGWVCRKNPQVIVKIVDGSVLGSGINGTASARAVRSQLISRPGWSSIDAVRNGKVLLLSQQLLEAPHLQLAAMVLIAKVSAPELMNDVDPGEMLNMLTEEATGVLPTGCFYYSATEE